MDIIINKRQKIKHMTSSTVSVCPHPGFFEELCIGCGRKADDDTALFSAYASSVPLDYLTKDMRLSKYQISRLKARDTDYLLGQKKLYLVLDLDHTLLHSIRLHDKDPDTAQDLVEQAENSLRGELFHLDSIGMVTKLRPFVRTFLEEANHIFKMYVYTRGNRNYANTMVGLLDPEGVYFENRVIAKEDCYKPCQKGLDVVLGQERAVLIVDDTEIVWPDNKDNLITVEKYDYFSQKNSGEESDGTLASVLEDLKKIHTKFFTEYDGTKIMEGDVRKVLKSVRGKSNP